MQLDQDKRGFSFMKEGPLDMRMNVEGAVTAAEVVNTWSESELGTLFRDLGEEPKWRVAAQAVVRARRKKHFQTTTELAATLSEAMPGKKRGKLHPATLVFQAIRMCVNRELESIQEGLQKALKHLNKEGRIGVISFHSFEDGLVKNIFREAARPIKDMETQDKKRLFELITKKPLVPTPEEVRQNRRSRSAKFRALARVD